MICSKCGKENPEGSVFCSYCGQSVQAQPVTQPVQYAQPVQQSSGGFSTGQKVTIIVLLLGVIAALSLVLFTSGNKEKLDKKKDDGTRTIMIYMVGSNLEYDSGIATADIEAIDTSKIDFDKTNILLYAGGTKEWKNEYISNEENGLFILTKDGYKKLEKYDKSNMGDPKLLSDFINYGQEKYPASHYNLVIYDHGGALDGAVYDDFSGDNLTLDDFNTALKDTKFGTDYKFDAVLFRTCLNGTFEVANLFSPYSDYIVFSEEVSYGGSTTDVLSFVNNLEGTDDGAEFGKKFVEQYKKQMSILDPFGTAGVTYSVVDLSKIDTVSEELDEFIKGVSITEHYDDISRVRSAMYQFGQAVGSSGYDTIDLYSFVDRIGSYSSKSPDKLKSAIKDAVVYSYSNIPSSNGLSVYFPYNGKAARIKYLKVYNNLTVPKGYKDFITTFYNTQSNASSFAFDLTKNETKVDSSKEVSLKLSEEEFKNYSRSAYAVFRKDKDHPKYYAMVYSSNDAKLSDDGVLTTNISDNLIVAVGEKENIHIPVFKRIYDGVEEIYTYGFAINPNTDIFDNKYQLSVIYDLGFKNDVPFIAAAKVDSSADERVVGSMLDFKIYTRAQIYRYEYKPVIEKGKFTGELEGAPEYYGISDNVEDFEFKKVTIDDGGEYYVVFYIYDINNNGYNTNFIKVGA